MKRYKSIHRYLLESSLKKIFSKIRDRNSIIDLGSPDSRHLYLYSDFEHYKIADLNPSSKNVLYVDLNCKLPFKTGIFDYILAAEVLEYISNQEVFFSECHRILKPGGKLILSTPMFANLHDDLIRLTEKALRLKLHEFKIVKINPLGNLFTVTLDYLRREVKYLSNFFYATQIFVLLFFGRKIQKIKSSYPSGYVVIAEV